MIISSLKRIKKRLQFTGWLQYLPIAIISLVFLLIAFISWLLDAQIALYVTLSIGSILLARVLFELVTVKLKMHPRERFPSTGNENLDLFDLMRLRRSCRAFQNRKLTTEHYNELMQYVQSIIESGNYPLIGKKPIRFEYVAESLTVWPTVGAQEFLIAIAPSEYSRLSVIDVGRSLQKIVMYATRMGLSTCWIGPGADHESIISHLGDRYNPTMDHIICVCALGYKSKYIPLLIRFINFLFHRRLQLSSLFFADSKFKKPLNINTEPFNQFCRNFEICQWAPSSFNSQTTRCAGILDQTGEIHNNDNILPTIKRFDFYQSTASHYYAPVALGIWCANWEMGCEALGIKGHFSVLTTKERGENVEDIKSKLPRYDVSWILEK